MGACRAERGDASHVVAEEALDHRVDLLGRFELIQVAGGIATFERSQ